MGDVRELRLSVTAPDYDAALRFYRDVLGLREEASYASDDGGHVTILSAGRATLEIADPAYAAYIDRVEVGSRVAGHLRVAFEVPDATSATASLAEAGATVVAAPVRTPWGSLNARLDGPGGLHLTVFSQDVHVGVRPRLDGPVHLADPDPRWARAAAGLVDGVRDALGERARLVEHVGSTSVPGLPAKPVLDVVVAVADSADEQTYVPALDAIGYRLRIREPEWHEHRVLKRVDPAVNLHVFSLGSDEIDRMVSFRDHLRHDARDRELYAATKAELAARTWAHVQDYADAKSDVVTDILSRAMLLTTRPATGVFVLVSGRATGSRTVLAQDIAARLALPLLAEETLVEALTRGTEAPPAGRAADALLAVAAQSPGAVLDGEWKEQHATAVAALPGRIVEVRVDEEGAKRPVGRWPVLALDPTTSPEGDRLARTVRQLAAGER